MTGRELRETAEDGRSRAEWTGAPCGGRERGTAQAPGGLGGEPLAGGGSAIVSKRGRLGGGRRRGLAGRRGGGGGQLQLGQLVDLGGQVGQGRLEGGEAGAGDGVALVVVDDVLDGVPGVGLEVLGPVEDVVHEVLGVVDDVLDEPGEGVLALRHLGGPFGGGRPCTRSFRLTTHRVTGPYLYTLRKS